MKKMNLTKKTLFAGLVLLIAGAIVFTVGICLAGGDFFALETVTYEQKSYTAKEEILSLRIGFSNADIRIEYDRNAENISVSYPVRYDKITEKQAEVLIGEEDGVLTVQENAQPLIMSWNLKTPTLTVLLPETEYKNMEISTQNGNIAADKISVSGELTLESENGNIQLGSLSANKAAVFTQNGNISLGTSSAEEFSARTKLGDIRLNGTLTANTAQFSTDMGDLDLDGAIIAAEDVNLSSNMGNITARFSGKQADYTAEIVQDMGKSNIQSFTGGDKKIFISADMGDINVSFEG